MEMWKSFDSLKSAVTDGVKEFGQVAIGGVKDMAEKVEDNSKMRISSPYISKSTTAEKRFPDPTTKTGGAPANKPPPALPGASKSRLAEGRRETVHRSVSEASNNYRQDQPATPCPKPKLDAGSGSQLTSSGNISRDTNSSAKEQNGQPPEAAQPYTSSSPQSSAKPQPSYTYNSRTRAASGRSSSDGNQMSAESSAGPEAQTSAGVGPTTATTKSLERKPSASPDPPAEAAPPRSTAQQDTPVTASVVEGGGDIKRAYADMKGAYDQMRELLKKSMDECMRLSDEVVRLESEVRQSQSKASESAASAKAARSETNNAAKALAAAQKEGEAKDKTMAWLQGKLDRKERDDAEAAATAQLDELHQELISAVRKASAAVDAREAADARAAASEAARAEAEAARQEADRLRREAQAEAHAAVSAAAAERNVRAEAEGLSESLKQDSERRARVFNNAVKTAVGRVQQELETERDELQSQLRDLQRMLVEARSELRRALHAAEEASSEASARTADANNAGNLAVVAEQMAERAVAREQDALAAALEASHAKQRAVAESEQLCLELSISSATVERATQQLAALQDDLEAMQQAAQAAQAETEREKMRLIERAEAASEALVSAERQLECARKEGTDGVTKADLQLEALQRRVKELEAEALQMRTSSNVLSMFHLPSKNDVLAGLGLEVCKDERLRWKSDVEEGGATLPPRPRSTIKKTGQEASGGSRLLGIVPLRIWLIAGYLSILHLMVMISFTRGNVVLDCDIRNSISNSTLGQEGVLP